MSQDRFKALAPHARSAEGRARGSALVASGGDVIGPLGPAAVARNAHIVIADAIRAKVSVTSLETLHLFVADHPVVRKAAPTYRQNIRMRLASALAVYLRELRPPANWALLDSEVEGPESRHDLVWRTAAGHVISDEIKSGRAIASELQSVQEQLRRQLAGGTAIYGSAYHGVRLCLLVQPAHSRFFDIHGDPQPLKEAR